MGILDPSTSLNRYGNSCMSKLFEFDLWSFVIVSCAQIQGTSKSIMCVAGSLPNLRHRVSMVLRVFWGISNLSNDIFCKFKGFYGLSRDPSTVVVTQIGGNYHTKRIATWVWKNIIDARDICICDSTLNKFPKESFLGENVEMALCHRPSFSRTWSYLVKSENT